MLPKNNRLTKLRDFTLTGKSGNRIPGNFCYVKFIKINPSWPKFDSSYSENTKIGIIVSKKISKSAVVRNKIKRRYREILRELVKGSSIRPGYMVVLYVQKNVSEKDYSELQNDTLYILRRAGLI